MRIRIRYFLLCILAALAFGYIVGWLWAPDSILYQIGDTPVGKGEHLSIFIALASSIFTLAAVIVALFKDEIVGNFKSVQVKAEPMCNTIEEYLIENIEGEPLVSKYYNQIIFTNSGNINALDCELLVERISFKGLGDVHPQTINVSKKKVALGGQEKTYIPKNGGSRESSLIDITVSEDPNGNKKTQLLIAENQVPSKAGTWTIEYCLNMSNATIQHYSFELFWDGHWHDVKSRMQVRTTKSN